MNKNLVVYYGTRLKKQNENYYCNGAFGRYIDEIATRYEKVFLVMPTFYIDGKERINEYQIKSKNVIFQEIIGYSGYIDALKKSRLIKRQINKYAESWRGVVYIRWPVPFFGYVHRTALKRKLPQCFHLVGDSKAVVSEGSKYSGIKKYLAIKYADLITSRLQKIINKTPTLVNGNGLRRLYENNNQNIREIRTSTFRESEIIKTVKEFDKERINLLYVGYLRHEKGLIYLLEAIGLLIKRGYKLKLSIIGEGDIVEELKSKSTSLNINDYIEFKGYIPLGDKLFEEYYKSDIFVLPSISEGTPRVLIEAMSKGLSVVATNVGGIPFTIKDGMNGVLVPPKHSEQLANAIAKVIDDDEFRKKLVANGIAFSKSNTIEAHVDEVVNFIGTTINHRSEDK